MAVSERFRSFLSNIMLTDAQQKDGATKRESVCRALNYRYYNSSSGTANIRYIGSWDKRTRIRPPRDVDVLFRLPDVVYYRYQERQGNIQSQLLQEVRSVLVSSFPNTSIRGDGPVVVVPFQTYAVELLPGFLTTSGLYLIPVTTNGGRYNRMDPDAEASHVSSSNTTTKNNTRDLIRMAKCWQAQCNVPIKSFWLELIAIDFLRLWQYAGNSTVYYDWIVRDFLDYMVHKENGYVRVPGTNEGIYLGNAWKSRTESAHARAVKACEYEANNMPVTALGEWQKIFGPYIQ